MPSDILSVYHKVWSNGFTTTFLHDSANCEHCLKGKLFIKRKRKYSFTNSIQTPEKNEAPESFFKQVTPLPVVKHENIPKNSNSHLGINLTKKVVAELNLKNKYKIPQIVLTPLDPNDIPPNTPIIYLPKRNCTSSKNTDNTCDNCTEKPIEIPAELDKRNYCKNSNKNTCITCDNYTEKLKKVPEVQTSKVLKKPLFKKLRPLRTPIEKVLTKHKNTVSNKLKNPIRKKASSKQELVKRKCSKNSNKNTSITYDNCIETSKKIPEVRVKNFMKKPLLKKRRRSKTPIENILTKHKNIVSNKLKNRVRKIISSKQENSCKLKSPVKNKVSSKQRSTIKEPNKGTLKRRRWNLQKLKKCNSNYEDDLFEDQKFSNFVTVDEDDSNSDKYDGMITPKISLSPFRSVSSSPSCRDCYSPTELFCNRKEAEEYIFRREKRRKLKLQDEKIGIADSTEKCKKREDTKDLLEHASKILKKFELKAENLNKESDEDEYFSDISNDFE